MNDAHGLSFVTKIVTIALLTVGCTRAAPKPRSFELTVYVESDPNHPLEGVKLLHAGEAVGISKADGRISMRANGNEGERLELEVACPTGYRSPDAPIHVSLRRPTSNGERPEYFAACPPLTRKLVVAARLEHGGNLPIRYLGRELARSDSAGVAHMLVEGETDKTIELTVDTSEQPQLRPKSPTARFRIGDRDDLVVLTQSFQSAVKPALHAARPAGPVRIR